MSVNMLIFISTIVMLWTTVGAVVTELTISGAHTVKDGEIVTLTCSANCASSCGYLWTGPTEINGSSLKSVTFSAKRSHQNVKFTCHVTDSSDNDTKQTDTSFDVYYGPDSVTVSTSGSKTIIEGNQSDTIHVTCTKPDCNPACKITWQGPGPVSQPTTSPTLNLFLPNQQITRKNAGTYTCTVLNTNTSQNRTASIQIIVHYAPNVTLQWIDSDRLECTAVGVPNTYTFKSIKHYVTNTLVRELPVNATGGKGIVNIMNKNFQDTGVYKCFVNNNITHYNNKQLDQEGDITVNITDKPQIIPTKETYNVSKNDPLDVKIMVYAIPSVNQVSMLDGNASVKYSSVTFNDTLVTLAFHRQNVNTTGQMIGVHFSHVLEEYFTTMTVFVSNDVGNSTVSITIVPQGAPDIPYNFTIASLSHDRVTTSLRTGFFNGASQTLVPQYKEPGNDTDWINGTSVNGGSVRDQFFQFEITGLKPETTYMFRVFSYNEFARSDYTPVLQQVTAKAPVAAGVIVGATLGGVVVTIIIVAVVIFLVRRRKLKQAQAKTSHTAKNSDLEVNMPTTPAHDDDASNEYTAEPKAPNFDLYENTRFKKTKTKTDNNGKESDYYNTKIKATPTTVVYRKSEEKLDEQAQVIPPYLELANNDPVEEAYFNVDISNKTANKTITGTPIPERQQSEEPYENTDISGSKEKKDYVNVEQYRKNKDTPVQDTPVAEEGLYLEMNMQPAKTKKNTDKDITKKNKDKDITKKNKDKDKNNRKNKTAEKVKLSHEDSTGSKELYVDMHKPDRHSVTSVPEYTAPPPPESLAPLEEEQYINIRFGTK